MEVRMIVRSYFRRDIIFRVNIIPRISFVDRFKKGDTNYLYQVGMYKSGLGGVCEIRKGLPLFWKIVVIVHELGHHMITIIARVSPPNYKYEKFWNPIIRLFSRSNYYRNLKRKIGDESMFKLKVKN